MEEQNKIADNKIDNDASYSEYRKKLEDYNNKIDAEKDKIKDLEDIEDLYVSLNKSINECVSILRDSVKGKNVTNKLNAIEENNAINLNKTISDIDIKKNDIKNNIVLLNNEKDKYEENFREKNTTEEGE